MPEAENSQEAEEEIISCREVAFEFSQWTSKERGLQTQITNTCKGREREREGLPVGE